MSADLEAAGMDTDLNTDITAPSLSMSENGEMSSDSEPDSSTSIDHSHEEFGHGKGHFHHPLESHYSHTNSSNRHGDTQGSFSHGTSDASGMASELSTVSIRLRPYDEAYANVNNNESI